MTTVEDPQVAFVDWLGVTFKLANLKIDESDHQQIEAFARWIVRQFVGTVAITDTQRGWSGYGVRWNFPGGLVAFGGSNASTVHLELTGEGCRQVSSWSAIAEILETYSARITRVDLAVDDHEGRDISIQWGLKQHAESGFKPSRGVSPNAHFIDDLGSGKGCTLYVGSRESGKVCRIYEKGKQLGDPCSTWVRAEVEFRASHREIPLDIVKNPTPYFSGAYPCFADVCNERLTIRTVMRVAAASLERTVQHAAKQAGSAIAALRELGFTAEKIIAKLSKPTLSDRLVPIVAAFKRSSLPSDIDLLSKVRESQFSAWRSVPASAICWGC